MRSDEARGLLDDEHRRLRRALDALAGGHDVGTQRETLGELSGMDEHLADCATETFDREVAIGLERSLLAELADVERAVARLAAGVYGRCRSCGAAIPDERLRAVPAARLCLDHQGRAELEAAALRDSVGHGPAESEATSHLDLLPIDDDGTAGLLGAEEAALHLRPER